MHVQHIQSLPALERLCEHVAPVRLYSGCCMNYDISGIGADQCAKHPLVVYQVQVPGCECDFLSVVRLMLFECCAACVEWGRGRGLQDLCRLRP